ncbi:SpoVR family protein [Piscibacillus halophilus]|uniref:SpoVR like protein n=1 Tax=Piscibacillus halophilus TaxID=571933 RepID=A0A1H9ASQ3_9BACI|nr:SpoVR family protein [Piscibacillus halophilus]SEP78948.1 SpoVR like protein [Piscibacillus halophilus]
MDYRKKLVTKEELLDIHHKGYRNRYSTSRVTNIQVLEMFELDQPPTIYLNQENSKIENEYVMAHCMGHIEFVQNNSILKGLRKPRLTYDMLFPYIQFDQFDLFLATMRTLGSTTQSLDSRFIAPVDYFLSNKKNWFLDWQKWLLKLIKEEVQYFNAIKQTKLMNEGWATFMQANALQKMNLTLREKLEVAQLEAQLHYKPEEGLNYYSLGQALWNEVPKEERMRVVKEFDDVGLIEKYYTEAVHQAEKITVAANRKVTDDYREVKRELILYFKHQSPIFYVDQEVTDETGYVTLRYQNSPYQIEANQINKIKGALEQILKLPIYIKPLYAQRVSN